MDDLAYPLSLQSQQVRAGQRARGEVRASFERTCARTGLSRLYQTGGLRLAIPNAGNRADGVIVNTGGGMAGGDTARLDFLFGEGAEVTLTTQSAEKIYRGEGETASVNASIQCAAATRLEWLPQETILFDGADLARRLEIDLAESATLLLVEAFTFGRIAYGEDRIAARLRDSWRIRRAGRLAFAEELRLGDSAKALNRPAIGAGARAMASLLIVAPDPPASLATLRAAFEPCGAASETLEWGASLVGGIVVARAVSSSPSVLRTAIVSVLAALRGRSAPRVWS
jgi:urease accessory protein